MVGLIPLMLKPAPAPASSLRTSSPSSSTFPSLSTSPTSSCSQKSPTSSSSSSSSPSTSPTRIVPSAFQLHFRAASTSALPSTPNRFSQYARRKRLSIRLSTISEPESESTTTMRRVSMPPMPSLPLTPTDWSHALAEVKRNFFNRRFRQCAARCSEIIDNTGKRASVEAVHLIYLHFYAAASLEQMARAMYSTSPGRAKLLQQARDHYSRADNVAVEEDDCISRSSRRSSAGSYSALSTSSRATSSTAMSSPTNSVYGAARSHSRASSCATTTSSKKRVTFLDCDDDDTSPAVQEPIIRPDSPTLGFDDWSSYDIEPETTKCAPSHEDLLSQNLHGLLLTHAPFNRYASLLSDIRVQVASHIDALDRQISASEPSIFNLAGTPSDCEEMRVIEMRARIERLRSNGWRRPRFDARRYEILCDNVLSEM